MKISFPNHWFEFIKVFKRKFEDEIVNDVVHVFRSEKEVQERYDTYQFEEFLPGYIPVADDSGGQVALISGKGNDPKVYLSSYGVLQEEQLTILDRDLLHWMQRRFPFDMEKTTISVEDLEKKARENDSLFQRIASYQDILQFLEESGTLEGLLLPENYATAEHIYYFQDGYHYNSVENKVLANKVPGDFQPDWVVLATNYFSDPFFIDLNEASSGFPVYFAYHGQGYWEPLKIAESLNHFKEIIKEVDSIRSDKGALQNYFRDYKDTGNPFWKEVLETVESLEEITDETIEQEIADSDWKQVSLYITDVGPNKMKIITLLKKEHNLSGQEALELSKSNRIFFRTGYYKWMQQDYQHLESLGARVEFEIME